MSNCELGKECKSIRYDNRLSLIKNNIIMKLRNNSNLVKLLKYDSKKALDSTNIVNSEIRDEIFLQGQKTTRVFLSGFDPNAVDETRSEVHIMFDHISNKAQTRNSPRSKIPNLEIVTIVHRDINTLNDGITQRHDLIHQEIHDTVVGEWVGTVGCIDVSVEEEFVLKNNTHQVWRAIYTIGEILE